MTEPTHRTVLGDDRGLLTRDLPFMARTLQSMLRPEGQAIRTELGVEAGVIGVLSIVWLNPGISQNELARSVVLKKSAVTALVKKLEARGLLVRQRNAKDRRINSLTLTSDGNALIARIRVLTTALNDRLFEGVGPDDRETFFRVMEQIVGNLAGLTDRAET